MSHFTLPISPNYVAHWGLWEAVRELIQNALDEQTREPLCELTVTRSEDSILHIGTSTGLLKPETLLLGSSSKSEDPSMRGKFGEGYKLALLVLTRLGHDVTINNGDCKWIPRIEYDEQFGAEVLKIHVESYEDWETDHPPGVQIYISGVDDEQWSAIQANVDLTTADESSIIYRNQEQGRIYVGGLYVTTAKEFEYGYRFRASTITLDRDRGMVNGFDLSYATSKLWTNQNEPVIVDSLLEKEAPDVKYVESHVTPTHTFTTSYSSRFTQKHGEDAIPVTTQHEVEQAAAAGLRWVLVPRVVKTLLGKVRRFFIPSTLTPVARLEKFLENHKWSLGDEQRRELEDIIAAMKPKVEVVK